MDITKIPVTKMILTELDSLDPVTVIMEDLKPGQGKVTMDCYGKAWTAYWGAIGDQKIAEFIKGADVDYLAKNFTVIPRTVTDYDAISQKINCDVDRDTLGLYQDDLVTAYGPDWMMDLPTTINHEYEYLCRIVSALKNAACAELE